MRNYATQDPTTELARRSMPNSVAVTECFEIAEAISKYCDIKVNPEDTLEFMCKKIAKYKPNSPIYKGIADFILYKKNYHERRRMKY